MKDCNIVCPWRQITITAGDTVYTHWAPCLQAQCPLYCRNPVKAVCYCLRAMEVATQAQEPYVPEYYYMGMQDDGE